MATESRESGAAPGSTETLRKVRHCPSDNPQTQMSVSLPLNPSSLTATERNSAPRSIADLLLENSRQRLFVHPLLWTSQHPQILQCHFVGQEVCEVATDGCQQPEILKIKTKKAKNAVRDLRYGACNKRLTRYAIDSLISSFFSCPKQDSLTFYYQYTTKQWIKVHNVFLGPYISLAYLNLDDLEHWRRGYVREKYQRALETHKWIENGPVLRTMRAQQRLLEPENRDEDPYILAVLLALAQRRQMGDSLDRTAWRDEASTDLGSLSLVDGVANGTTPSKEESFKVGVLTTRLNDAKGFLRLYTCRVPAAFLSRFDMPKSKYETAPLEISYSTIQLSPSSVALEQLTAVLLSP